MASPMNDAPIKIAVVDDDPAVRTATCRILQRAGHRVSQAATGTAALHLVQAGRPDLVLLDVVLPDLDGTEVCRRIKADPALAGIHVLLASGRRTASHEQADGLAAGADGYIARPVSNRELRERVNAAVRIIRAERQRDRSIRELNRVQAQLEQARSEMERQVLERTRELQDAVAALKRKEASFRLLADNAMDMVSTHDLEGVYTYASPSCADLLGCRPDQLVGRPAYELFHPEDLDAVRASHRAILQRPDKQAVEYRIRHRDGRYLWVETISKTIRDPSSGEPREIICTTRDVSERKKAELAWREAMADIQALFNASAETAVLLDRDATILAINDTGARRLGKLVADLVGVNALGLFPPDLARTRGRELGRVLREGRPHRFEDERGGMILDNHLHPILDGSGRVVRIAMFVRDVTAARRMESAQQAKYELLKHISSAADVAVLMNGVIGLLKTFTGIDAVGIRIRDGDDYPYYETSGFPPAFVQAESRLCEIDADGIPRRDAGANPVLECMCGIVIQGRTDPDQPFFTARGSFWTNSTSTLLASTSEADRQIRTRNRCHGEGYESVALIPLVARGEPYGLIQLNDRRPDRFTPETIALMEEIADNLAMAVAKYFADEALKTSEAGLATAQSIAHLGSFVWDFATDRIQCSDELLRLFEFTREAFDGRNATLISRIHPEDRPRVQAANAAVTETGRIDPIDFRIVRRDGSLRYVRAQGDLVYDVEDRPAGMNGTVLDITALTRNTLALEAHQAELMLKTRELEEVNTALRVLLTKTEEERAKIERNLLNNVQELVLPYITRLRQDPLTPRQASLLAVLEQNLAGITTPLSPRLHTPESHLTPALIQVADLIKKGLTTKEIAAALGLSVKSVESYRKRIRERLNIKNKKANLRAYLMSRS